MYLLHQNFDFWFRNPGVSSMIVCVPQDFKWLSPQPFDGIVASFFATAQDLSIMKNFRVN